MAGFRVGKGYFGVADIETTTQADEEIIQAFAKQGDTHFNSYKLTFKPYADCHIKINGGDYIFWEANQYLNIDMHDEVIRTIHIKEAGTSYYLFGAY